MLHKSRYLPLVTALFALIESANAQTTTSTTTAPASIHTVNVGKADHKFDPDVIHAEVGDIILFNFYPTNHSVVQAEYGGTNPCVPIERTGSAAPGFFSGFKVTDEISLNPPSWQLRVNTTEPVFFYCSAPNSCTDYTMVGVINPNATQTLAVQKKKAGEVAYQLSPGEPWPDEAGPSPSPVSAARPAGESEGSPASDIAQPSASTPSSSGQKSTFPAGAIAGIVIGVAVIIGLAAALAFLIGRHGKNRRAEATTLAYGDHDRQAGTSSIQPIRGPGGVLYVPVQYVHDNRVSVGSGPPNYPCEAPSPLVPRWSTISTQEVQLDNRLSAPASPPVELYAPKYRDGRT